MPRILAADERIDFSVRDRELGELAQFIYRITETEVLVPASELGKRVTVQLDGTTIGESLKELGLYPASPPARAS